MSEGLRGLKGWFSRSAIGDSAAVPVTARAFHIQGQAFTIHIHVSVPPVSIAKQAGKRYIQLRVLRKRFGMKTTLHNLQQEVVVHVPSVDEQQIWQSGSEAELHPVALVAAVLDLPLAPSFYINLDVNESWGGKGEGCSRRAPLIIEAVRAQACVPVFAPLQPRTAGGSILTLVAHTAVEFDLAVASSPGKLARRCFGTVAHVGRSAILTPATVLTGLTLTLINVHFAQFPCMESADS